MEVDRVKKIKNPILVIAMLCSFASGLLFGVFTVDRGSAIEPEKEESVAVIDTSNSWNLRLVNGENPLQEGENPELKEVFEGVFFDERAADSLRTMIDAAKSQGLNPIICSAYRSVEEQKYLFNEEVKKLRKMGFTDEVAVSKASTSVAPPGTSEHNLGLAADIVSYGYQILDEAQENTEEAKWLMANCHDYGFILRYPRDKQEVTGIKYEPWHYRFVGKKAAKEIKERDLSLEEYLKLS